MKRFLFVIVCLVVVSAAGFAQRNNHRQSPEERAQRMTEWMTKELQLTPEQVVPIDSINLVFAKAQDELFKSKGDRASMREDMRKLHALRLEAYEKVLTDEQLETYKKLMEERMQNRENRGNKARRGK